MRHLSSEPGATAPGGGASGLSGGEIYLGGSGGTEVQRTAGFEDTTEDFAAYLKMAGGPCADEAKVMAAAAAGGARLEAKVELERTGGK